MIFELVICNLHHIKCEQKMNTCTLFLLEHPRVWDGVGDDSSWLVAGVATDDGVDYMIRLLIIRAPDALFKQISLMTPYQFKTVSNLVMNEYTIESTEASLVSIQ